MNKKNMWIVMLLIVGVCGFAYFEGYAKPKAREQEARYEAEQKDPRTHDISVTAEYRNEYMGNAGNLSNLNHTLPYGGHGLTFQLYPDELTAELKFKTSAKEWEPAKLKTMLMYNSTANFVFIDNLQKLRMTFSDAEYTIERKKAEEWYGEAERLSALRDGQRWKEDVQGRVNDPAAVDAFYDQVVEVKEK
ncbi:DUF4825 domain-containing protein [Paenibacillus sp. DMB20]|uniref:DUF4825 domain-containing protein n=1 Tax=Paenibacillus sp. DMB20 TaxID=1642570 RepID=UPI000627F75F|nr:DUF4825 domain-containing protein [Paenibacillus sp. DMB20]KKO53666.1 hypothetical protein XI25_11770 [Paenibacillus sp. DMB20]